MAVILPKSTLIVKVLPKTSKEEVVGWEADVLKIRLKAVPEKGEANKALIAFLAKILDLSKQSIDIVSGETSRRKRLCITGLSQSELTKRLNLLIERRSSG
jgi:uncharacterized protein (TIGR00251 family)